jgi:outer membrane protein TolC
MLRFVMLGNAQSHSTDSLELTAIVRQVINHYPSIKKAEQDIEAANARIGLAKSAYAPLVNASASYTRVAPVISLALDSVRTFDMNPANNYNAGVNYNQMIYDFGKTANKVELENQNKKLSELSVNQLKQQVSLSILNHFYSILYLQEAIKIKNDEIKTLTEHLHFVEKLAASGSATQYTILSTKVRISNTQNQIEDLTTSLQVLQTQLNSFIGNLPETPITVKSELLLPVLPESNEMLFNKAYQQREELKLAQQKSEIASLRYRMAGNVNKPELDFFASGGFKNGYIPNLNAFKPNYAAGVGLKIPLFDGHKIKYNQLNIQSEINGLEQETELIRRNITNDIVENKAGVISALKKIAQQELQVEQAQKAYELAQASFKAGVITNLDLLDSETALAESRLALMKSNIDYTVSALRVRIATGEKIY